MGDHSVNDVVLGGATWCSGSGAAQSGLEIRNHEAARDQKIRRLSRDVCNEYAVRSPSSCNDSTVTSNAQSTHRTTQH